MKLLKRVTFVTLQIYSVTDKQQLLKLVNK